MSGAFARRPWLLVWVAFLVLIAVWVTAFKMSGRIPTQQLTPVEEAALLRGDGGR